MNKLNIDEFITNLEKDINSDTNTTYKPLKSDSTDEESIDNNNKDNNNKDNNNKKPNKKKQDVNKDVDKDSNDGKMFRKRLI